MGRRRKRPEAPPETQPSLPLDKEPENEVPTFPSPAVPKPDPQKILKSAEEWATRNGLKGPFTLTGPEVVSYPRSGFGYLVLVHENNGQARLGSARFDAAGKRSMWTMDGVYGG